MIGSLKGIWGYKHFIVASIRNEMTSRFSRSRLGGAWMIIHPMSLVLTYALILSAVLSAKLPGIDNRYAYAIYLTAGMLGWTLFTEILNRCIGIFIENANLIKKLKFPKSVLPLIATGSALINYAILLTIIVVVFSALGHFIDWSILWILYLTAICILFSLGIGLFLGILNVFMRDIGQVIPIAMQFLFWFTPVVYPVSIIPDYLSQWVTLNPLFHLITGYHDVLVYNKAPDILSTSIVGLAGTIMLAISFFLYRKASPEMVDVL